MEENLKNSLLSVCKTLNKFDVQYLLVGGTAVALNGYFRYSVNINGELTDKPDVDVWYNPTYENYFNVLKVVKELGKDVTDSTANQIQILKNRFLSLISKNLALICCPKSKPPSGSWKHIKIERLFKLMKLTFIS